MRGGIRVESHKAASTREPIARAPRPAELVLPLSQHAGEPAVPTVAVGDRVLRGQPIARPSAPISAALHAPASGTVTAVEPRVVAHPSGLAAPCIVIAVDDADTDWPGLAPLADWPQAGPAALRAFIRDAGIVGLGGAAFPSHVKLTPPAPVRTLLLNGAECEPYISCDDRLMRERADHVAAGIPILMHALGAERCVVAIEDDKPEAIDAMSRAVPDGVEVRTVPALYPQGGERQLVHTVFGVDVPRGALPPSIGVVCHNVATAAAVADAVLRGEPMTRRIVTVTGDAVRAPRNLDALVGTPVSVLLDACSAGPAERLQMGGPMMGFEIASASVSVVKGMNCVLASTARAAAAPKSACIRCGECAVACPETLLPQQLWWHAGAREFDKAASHALFDCIECGVCDAVCPSGLPLVDTIRWAKGEIWLRADERRRAELSKRRYDARTARLTAEQRARDERLRKRQDPAAIDAALARIKAKADA